jgi:CHASE3 domain sensor protein
MPEQCHFEYVFYYLFRTYLWEAEGNRREEPTMLDLDTKSSIRFEEDKRLFRHDVPRGESLDNWEKHWLAGWQNLSQLYAQAADNPEQGRQYCQQALLGVALLILEDGDSVEHHTVTIAVKPPPPTKTGDKMQLLRFKAKLNSLLFSLKTNEDKPVAHLHALTPMTPGGKPFLRNLQLEWASTRPVLVPMVEGELTPNPVFSVYGFSFGGSPDSLLEEKLVKAPFNRQPLLSSVFVRLIIRQWQFGRIDEAAKLLRPELQSRYTAYANYANQYGEARPRCARTRQLESQLRNMQMLNNQATFLISRIESALKTLEINGKNLTRRLAQIREETPDNPWQLELGGESDKIQWQPQDELEKPLLAVFYRAIRRLENHKAYLESHVKYLNGLQERWQIYLAQRRSKASDDLNVLLTIFILLVAGPGVTFNSKSLGLQVDAWVMYLVIVLLLIPIAWRMIGWVGKQLCCIFHDMAFDKLLCHRIFRWLEKLETFRLFRKEDN